MSTIEPITFPLNKGIATKLNVLVLNFQTNATTATTYYQLLSDEDINLSDGNYTLTEEEFADYSHFVTMKAKLVIDQREIDEKIKLGDEQLVALRETLHLGRPRI